ncbi:MAG: tRNA (N(6)-L-threonylcarbamoyladenosine(37)-C(2))-methylthiotransferase MtaB [Deltaproteobacteria bacterium]|nr:tRNA (N(6)-L-threonylcarbamoyladenosine(37)-C(2))-methylthiotransferase MtaB [Deltaproteobacteria bacterium]MBI2210006.1 tRNA (N(6)-L-threonylcarbamoyladenosine(37)-C(2))-methylthiotransferase MtaB [Deltaproteobacteria bacterium]MBI2348575.1 tRNA (N(6)-L-threonylcarbamoyladenosine(37)-C(2))-methylthiotransferase MtaB [Deltaproteobacteria bacterium]MBI2538950.1 tRNA (N(6)-L-threonylcarbamoyladenosine(37)-C(2))-methylthiotransferase MtaB [Deltaproteobacteria bacterium]MBI2991971.1 tRNA (N(6)-L
MRIAITTLGCKINQYDSAVIRARLEDGHFFVPFDEQADCYIINSCTVTDRADWEARQLVRRAKRLSPESRVLLTGCYAQVSPEQAAQVPGVDYVVGLNRLDDLVRFVGEADGNRPDGVKVSVVDVKKERGVPVLGARELPDHTRAFVKIQEGCNYSCTYCIIPTARGLSRSVPPEQVLAQIRSLAERGFMEIVLTGIHLGGYGQDLRPRIDLTSLLERIIECRFIPRVRLSSLDPREVPERLLRLMARSDMLCPHLHVCAQAGEDRILKQMRRNYDTAYYREVVTAAREMLPDAALGSDIIVGFPGESDGDFCRSLEFFDSLPLTYFHVFPHSIRSGTVAAGLEGQVPPAIKKERGGRMRELGAKKKREFYRGFIGRRAAVLVERAVHRASGARRGYSRNYLPVLLHAGDADINREVDVVMDGLASGWLTGRIVDDRTSGQQGSCQQSAQGLAES